MIRYDDVCAVLVTRGDVDMSFADDLPYGEVMVVDNSKRAYDAKVYARYVAAELGTTRPIIYFQDDDVSFHRHDDLLAAYKPGVLVANMYDEWIESCGYYDLALVGLGSIMDNRLWVPAFERWKKADFPETDNGLRFELDCDFIFGALTPFKRYDFGHEILDIASDDSRLWRQKGQMEGKWETITRARSLRKLTLAIMTKNEEANISRVINSARAWIDSVTILDTGSTDGTRELAQAECDHLGVPLHWHVGDFVGFGPSRNWLLALARQYGEYILMLDADEELIFAGLDEPPRPELWADGYMLHYEGEVDYAQPRIIASRFPFKFDNVAVHAALDHDHPTFEPTAVNLFDPLIRHHGWDRAATLERIQAQVEQLNDLIDRDVDVPRHTFLLAKAYEGLALHGDGEALDKAINGYRHRAEMSDGDEEAYYSRFRLGCLLAEHRNEFLNACDQLLQAWESRPGRIEALRMLVHYATAVADATPYPENDLLIVHREMYKHGPKGGQT